MDIKIGNSIKLLFFCVSFFVTLDAADRLELRVVTRTNDTAVTTMALGVPYTLELKVEGMHDLHNCTIAGLENFHSEFFGASQISWMANSSIVHSYVIRADTVGDFTLGPATLVTKTGTVLSSNVLSLKVEQQQQSDVIVELLLNQKSVVVGQKATGKLCIHTCVNSQLINLQTPSMDQELGTFAQLPDHVQTTRTIEGKNYNSYEIPITVLFKKPGRFSLPKVGALCRVQNQKKQHSFPFGFSMYGAQDIWFYSAQPVVLEVEALPPLSSTNHFLGIGLFDSVALMCKQKSATQGEGIVVLLDIIGREGVDDLQPPPLDLPDGLKYYESKSTFEKLSNGSYKKSCEYIIQATRDHTFEVNPQRYSYFDTASRTYKHLTTNSFKLEITGGKKRFQEHDLPKQLDLHNDLINDEKIASIKTDGPWFYTPERALSTRWFLLCVGLIVCAMVLGYIRKYRSGLTSDYWMQKRKRDAFNATRKTVAQLKKQNNYSQLYDTFNQLFKDRCQLLPAEVTADIIEDRLKKAGFVRESVEQWNRFFLQLAELAYCKQGAFSRVPEDLFKRASMWINQLEEKL